MQIVELRDFSEADFGAMAALMRELSGEIVLTRQSLERLLSDPGSHLYVCREDDGGAATSLSSSGCHPSSSPGRIVGCACLCVYHQPFETDASIESVVVSSAVRGRGVGRLLVQHLIEEARRLGVQQLHLTSRPSRVAANALYRRLGFQPKETNCYILDL